MAKAASKSTSTVLSPQQFHDVVEAASKNVVPADEKEAERLGRVLKASKRFAEQAGKAEERAARKAAQIAKLRERLAKLEGN